jgi:hypothetical protein
MEAAENLKEEVIWFGNRRKSCKLFTMTFAIKHFFKTYFIGPNSTLIPSYASIKIKNLHQQ